MHVFPNPNSNGRYLCVFIDLLNKKRQSLENVSIIVIIVSVFISGKEERKRYIYRNYKIFDNTNFHKVFENKLNQCCKEYRNFEETKL